MSPSRLKEGCRKSGYFSAIIDMNAKKRPPLGGAFPCIRIAATRRLYIALCKGQG